ncbi:MAG: polyprenyl diphosphate synthase [Gemmatimonadota bacterium]
MPQSSGCTWSAPGLHVAIIMDGNGRWATARGMPRAAGHREGALAVRPVVEAAPALGIGTLTLFAFSADNWQRPEREVAWLMRLFREYLRGEVTRCLATGVRLNVIGRRDRLPAPLVAVMEDAEVRTARGRRLLLRIAVDYSARDTIVRAAMLGAAAAAAAASGADAGVEARNVAGSRAQFAELLCRANHGPAVPDVDLLVRTGGEQRLSDFLLWECAYAELHFSSRMWPAFTAGDLERALADFHGRQRRFGGLPSGEREPDVAPATAQIAGLSLHQSRKTV